MGVLEDRLVEYAKTLDAKALPPAVIHHAKRRVVDTLASALAAGSVPAVRIACRMAVPTGGALRARVWGSLVETSPEMAAFANGVMLRYLDLSDTYGSPGGTHPSDCIGGILAMAEATGASGAEFLRAVVLSYEIQARIVDSVPFVAMGWDQAIVVGLIANTLAIGSLLGLSPGQMRGALAIAIIPNLSTLQSRAGGEISMWKGCAAANGARQSVFAAMLAAEGMEGPYEPFDGRFGLWKMTVGKPYEIRPFATPSNGIAFGITESFIKKYPIRYSLQLPVDTALKLRAAVAPGEIESLTIETFQATHDAFTNPEFWAPRTRETADHSLPVSVAIALVDGEVTPSSFAAERFKAAEVLDMVKRTRIEVSKEFTDAAPSIAAAGIRNCRITATTRDGGTRQAHLALTREDLVGGPSDREIEDKFERLTRDVMPGPRRRALLDTLWRLDEVQNIAELVDLLAF